ncbi:hypothetical protein TNIN_59461 [Trichonephila inaurata madagascariensis]|uniref:Uncharacterized protein n=1 Tax=Trichonephila inaurata madagascariensis TaxID=2747483 RepID=A0A8X6YFF9_9ARAC|nr:hypothetical protein TNIN_59461 [Trichonephila inaurata madagascariensis]
MDIPCDRDNRKEWLIKENDGGVKRLPKGIPKKSRLNLERRHKSKERNNEKETAKRRRKVTKTLVIVLAGYLQ